MRFFRKIANCILPPLPAPTTENPGYMVVSYGSIILLDLYKATGSDLDFKPDGYIVYFAEHVHIAQTQTRIPAPYFYMRQESESKSVPIPESGNVFKVRQSIPDM